jgi:hypothetical protein
MLSPGQPKLNTQSENELLFLSELQASSETCQVIYHIGLWTKTLIRDI